MRRSGQHEDRLICRVHWILEAVGDPARFNPSEWKNQQQQRVRDFQALPFPEYRVVAHLSFLLSRHQKIVLRIINPDFIQLKFASNGTASYAEQG